MKPFSAIYAVMGIALTIVVGLVSWVQSATQPSSQVAPTPRPTIAPKTFDPYAVLLSAPQTGTLLNERVQVTLLDPWPGQLVFTHIDFDAPLAPSYLSFLPTGEEGNPQLDISAAATYQAVRPALPVSRKVDYVALYRPLISPEGRYTLLKFGVWSDFRGKHRLSLFDTQTKTLKLVTKRMISNVFASLSPDGQYVAYIEGGDVKGDANYIFGSETVHDPLTLWICNWRTGQEYKVITNDTVRGPLNWIAPHTLIFGMLSDEKQAQLEQSRQSKLKSKTVPVTVPRPNIYEYSIEKKELQLTIQDGYYPTPSPDGKWVAFFGSENPRKPRPLPEVWDLIPQGAALCIARRDGSERAPINQEAEDYPKVFWMSDNQHFVTLTQTRWSPHAAAKVKVGDRISRTYETVASLNAVDYQRSVTSVIDLQFRPMRISADNKTLFVIVTEDTGRDKRLPISLTLQSLQAINLRDGKIKTIAQITNTTNTDWYETLPPASNNQ